MPNASPRVQELTKHRDELKAKIVQVDDFRPGSLMERYRRCGKPTCHCAKEGEAGHGPSWSLTLEVGGKTVTRTIPPDAVETTRQQIAEEKRGHPLRGTLSRGKMIPGGNGVPENLTYVK